MIEKIAMGMAIIFFIIFFVLSIVRLSNSNSRDLKDVYTCNETNLFKLWVENRLAPSRCPKYSNNLIVLDDYTLNKKDVTYDSDGNCCLFDRNNLTYIEKPFVCSAVLDDSYQFSVTDLNKNPYEFNGNSIQFVNPICTPDINCLTLLYDENTNKYRPSGVIPALGGNTSLNNRISFKLGNDCNNLHGVYLDDVEMTYRNTDGDILLRTEFVYGETEPNLSFSVRNLFNNGGRFYPIAGNPSMSIF